jgi:hypothetical protein
VGHYTLDELIELWTRERLTTEQMIGQILQVLRAQERRLRALTRAGQGHHPNERAGHGGCADHLGPQE